MISPRLFFISLHHTMYRNAKPVDWCQCCQQRVALSYSHGSSDLLGDDHTPKIVDSADYSCCFHIYKSPRFYRFVLLVSAKRGDLYLILLSNLRFSLWQLLDHSETALGRGSYKKQWSKAPLFLCFEGVKL